MSYLKSSTRFLQLSTRYRLICCTHPPVTENALLSLPGQPSQADKHASPSPACQFALCWTYIFINLTLTKLFPVLQGQLLPGVTAQTSTDVNFRQFLPAEVRPENVGFVSDTLIPHEARFILDSCPFSGQLSAWGGLHFFCQIELDKSVSQQKFLQLYL